MCTTYVERTKDGTGVSVAQIRESPFLATVVTLYWLDIKRRHPIVKRKYVHNSLLIVSHSFYLFFFFLPFLVLFARYVEFRKLWCCPRTNSTANRPILLTGWVAEHSASSSTICPLTSLSNRCRNRCPSSSLCTLKCFCRMAWLATRSNSCVRRTSSSRWSSILLIRKIIRLHRAGGRLPLGRRTSGVGTIVDRSSPAARNCCASSSSPSQKFAKVFSKNEEPWAKPSKVWVNTDWLALPMRIWWIYTMPYRYRTKNSSITFNLLIVRLEFDLTFQDDVLKNETFFLLCNRLEMVILIVLFPWCFTMM